MELEQRAMWAIKQLNFDLKKADDLRKLQISELEEIRNDAYDSARISKYRTKLFHEKSINRKNFVPKQKVLLYNSRLHFFPGKLKIRWSGPYIVQTFSLMVLLRFQIPRMVACSKSMAND